MEDGAKVLGGVAEDVTAIIADVIDNAPIVAHERISAALGGTSLALARCAYDLVIPREYLKERICADIDAVYDTEDALKEANLQ